MNKEITKINVSVEELDSRINLITRAKKGEKLERYPVMVDISDFSYADIYGIDYDTYLSDPVKHAEAQITGKKWVFENLKTDITGFYVGPQQGAFPSLFGAPLVKHSGNRTWIQPWIKGPEDLKKLEEIDIENTGIEVANTEWKNIFKNVADDYPVQFKNGEVFYPLSSQGLPLVGATEDPLTVAVDLMGADNFFMACVTEPEFVRDFINIITDKLCAVITKNEKASGFNGEVFVSSDYAPMLSPEMYADFVVPSLVKIKNTISGPMRLHHCDVPGQLVDIILSEIKPEIINGFKSKHDLIGGMKVMAEKVGDKAYLEPYLDGTVMMHQTYDEIYNDALSVIELFDSHNCRFHLGAMSADCHPVDKLTNLNAVMQASVDYSNGKRIK